MSFDWEPRERKLAVTSIIGTGDALVNFLSWACEHELSLDQAMYDDVLRYQDDMQSGMWSEADKPLAGRTINRRGSAACSYLMWMGEIGARPAFAPRLKTATIHTRGRAYKKTVRTGLKKARRSQIERVGLPPESWVDDWLAEVERRRGKPKMLSCRLIVDVGPRKAEVCGADVARWPSKEAIIDAARWGQRHVEMVLEYTKGNVPRTVLIEVSFAKMVRGWIDEERPKLVKAFVRRTRQPAPSALFLSDAPGYEGTPISRNRLYECFKLKVPGYAGRWYPHKGRHYFTCMYIMKQIESAAALHAKTITEMPADWVHGQVVNYWELASELLGHSDPATTKVYTRWIVTIHHGSDVSERWESEFDEENVP